MSTSSVIHPLGPANAIIVALLSAAICGISCYLALWFMYKFGDDARWWKFAIAIPLGFLALLVYFASGIVMVGALVSLGYHAGRAVGVWS